MKSLDGRGKHDSPSLKFTVTSHGNPVLCERRLLFISVPLPSYIVLCLLHISSSVINAVWSWSGLLASDGWASICVLWVLLWLCRVDSVESVLHRFPPLSEAALLGRNKIDFFKSKLGQTLFPAFIFILSVLNEAWLDLSFNFCLSFALKHNLKFYF